MNVEESDEIGPAIPVAVCFDVGSDLVERHRPSSAAPGVAGNAGMSHHHLHAAADFLEVDAHLRSSRDAPLACPYLWGTARCRSRRTWTRCRRWGGQGLAEEASPGMGSQ